ncbi:T9SS type A sorting domain-containing protein [Aestuariivivens sediminicola]|uniref:T9SS type A sorting domain-containing protein n=1 Tax=Aestuariivivens sediminicola TaxID=2913560 RepID=UPI001F590597|nr:T9SS type A sorting domain-containing protein [Aestuariivivens sediminicola]
MKEKVHVLPSNLLYSESKKLLFVLLFSLLSILALQAQNSNASDTGHDNANENATVEGGTVSTVDGLDYVEACFGDDEPDVFNFHVEGASGRLKQWVITDDWDNILYLPEEPMFDFNNEEEERTLRVYHISYNGMKPLVHPFWHKHIKNLSDLRGKFDISDNYIEVKLIQQPEGGTISLADGSTEIEICAGDGHSDLFAVNVTGANGGAGVNMIWVVTETNYDIVMTSMDNSFDFEDDGDGTYWIWHLSYAENVSLDGLTNALDLMGCFDLSNPITVIRNGVDAGSIAIANGGGTEIEICAGDGVSDAFDVEVTGDLLGDNMAWVITDNADDPEILALPEGPPFDLEGAGDGTCLIWHIAFEDGLTGAEVGNNVSALMGCYVLSNAITVIRNGVNAGSIAIANDGGTEIEICAGDGVSDAFDVEVTGDLLGDNMAWVITDNADDPEILALPDGPPFDLEGAGDGTCLIWHIAFEDGLTGAEVGNNVSALMGCYVLSNAITVIRNGVNAGNIAIANDGGTEIEICAGDGVSDAFDVEVTGDLLGDNMAWVITDNADDPEILALPDGPPFDLEEAGDGVCLIWHIAFEDGLTGAEVGNNVSALSGCLSLSNAIQVTRIGVHGGTIAGGEDNNFSFTVGDETADTIADGAITLEGQMGTNSAWVLTNEDATVILALPENYTDLDFDGSEAGVNKLWHLSYADGLEGLTPPDEGDHLVSGLAGCFSLSNAITITLEAAASGKIALYPNPTKGLVSINLNNFSGDNLNISLYNLRSARLYNQNVSFSGLSKIQEVNVDDLDSGLYFVKVTNLETGATAVKGLVID